MGFHLPEIHEAGVLGPRPKKNIFRHAELRHQAKLLINRDHTCPTGVHGVPGNDFFSIENKAAAIKIDCAG